MIPAVAYVRMSSDKQEASPHQQRDEIEQLAKQHGYVINYWYTDEGISGDATEKRIDFQRMIKDAERGEFEAILCWDMDRFGRFDSIEAGRWIHPLRQNGIYLVTVAQGKIDWSDFAGRMLYGIQQEGKHAYLRDLSRNVCRGLREKAKQGKWPAGKPPFGYVIGADGKLALGDPEHVRAVQRVFREYRDGNSMRGIVSRMRALGQPTPGKEWTHDVLRGVLTKEYYTGDFRWGDRKAGKYHTATDDPICIPNNHAVIVDRETFAAVQERRVRQRGGKTPKRNGGSFVLSGLAKCHHCGMGMYGHTTHGKNYLICSGYNRKGKEFCQRNAVREEVVLECIMDAIEREYLNPVLIKRVREASRRQVEDAASAVDVGSLKQELAQVTRDMETARRNMVLADANLLPEFKKVFRDLRSKHGELEAEIKAASSPRTEDPDETVDRAVALLTQLRDTCCRADPAHLREFLRQAIEKVVIRAE